MTPSVAVESTMMAAIGYDAERRVLRVEFRDQSIYDYLAVPAEVHKALLCSLSKGSYFNRVIRGRFAYQRVSDDSLS